MGDIEQERSTFGKWLRQQRRVLDLTQQDLADQVGCARMTLRRIESDALKPSKELALILLEKVGIPNSERADWLPFTRGLADLPVKQTNPFPITLRNNLPAFLTTFIGREKEQADVIKLITKHRLVTLTGSGGVGKTRLSIQVATELLSEYPIGIWLVELAPLTDPALVPQSVCAVLGVKPEGNTSVLEALTNYLHSKKVLLVMDNCEHLIDACAQLSDSLLRACPELRIIASSREAMGINGEHAYRVPSLSLPNSKSILQIIQASEAVELFMQRATALQSDFELKESNAPFIAHICQRLDGIALAIELAASRVKMFKVEQIAARLDDAFGLLTSGNRTALPRQQTLRALIDWSYNLLSEDEKIFLRKLSVFRGGWTLEAAEAVCGNEKALELLTHLVDKSLVSIDHEHGDAARYYLLETIRQYAREKLVESNKDENVYSQHLTYFLKFAEEAEPHLVRKEQLEWFNRLEIDHDNLRLALEWATENVQDDPSEAALRLVNALKLFWYMQGYWMEGKEWCARALEKSRKSIPTIARTWALIGIAMFGSGNEWKSRIKLYDEISVLCQELGNKAGIAETLLLKGIMVRNHLNNSAGRSLIQESLNLFSELGDKRGIARANYNIGNCALNEYNFPAARQYFEESLRLCREIGERRFTAIALMGLGELEMNQGNLSEAHLLYEESLSLGRKMGDKHGMAMYLDGLGTVALGQGDYLQANNCYEESLMIARELGSVIDIPHTLLSKGQVARFQGDYENAINSYTEALAFSRELEYKPDIAFALLSLGVLARLQNNHVTARSFLVEGLTIISKESNELKTIAYFLDEAASLIATQGKAKRAAILFSAAGAIRDAIHFIPFPVEHTNIDHNVAQVRSQLSESEFNAAWAEGQSMSQEQAFALAMEVLQ